MKAISTIIIIVMLLLISIALISIVYLWLSAITGTVTTSGTESTTEIIRQMSGCLKIDAISNNQIYITNCGAGIITNESLAVFIDDTKVEHVATSIEKSKRGVINVSGLLDFLPGIYTLKVVHIVTSASVLVEIEVIEEEGLTGRWSFDEGSGTVVIDSSGNGNYGTLGDGTCSPGSDSCPAWVDGRFGYALEFDGIDDFVFVADSYSLDITDEITIEAWVNALATASVIPSSMPGWQYMRPVTLSPATQEADYQVKVELTTSNFDYSHAESDGKDIRFTDTNENPLSYWIEEWDASGTSVIWVKVTTAGTDTFDIYYGNPSATSASNPIAFQVQDIDGNMYDTVTIGTQRWMKQNLNVTKNPSGVAIARYCYNNDPSICVTDGGLYDLNTMMNGAASCNGIGASQPACSTPVQGICPNGWHIPSHYEYTLLEKNVGSNPGAFPYDTTTTGWLGTDEGTNLKTGGSSGFNVVLAGYRYTDPEGSTFRYRGRDAWLRSSTDAWDRGLNSGPATVDRWDRTHAKVYGFSVRCLKDSASPEPVATIGAEIEIVTSSTSENSVVSKQDAYNITTNATDIFAGINDQNISASIPTGWNYVALTYDKTNLNIYVNGNLQDTTPFTEPINTNTFNLIIGNSFNGTIDEVRIWDKALSTEKIHEIYDKPLDNKIVVMKKAK